MGTKRIEETLLSLTAESSYYFNNIQKISRDYRGLRLKLFSIDVEEE